MNDFTKEELEYFILALNEYPWLWKDDPIKLENKIQSMIDDYDKNDKIIYTMID